MAKIGIIQSRGLGDIIIALPLARWYYNRNHHIVWPICSEFMGSVQTAAPWVEWIPMETDPQGRFFLEVPRAILESQGVESQNQLYLYQYLSSHPELTDPELFSILKFDQYKYWVAEVPFREKWNIRSCIERDEGRERELLERLRISPRDRIAISHTSGSTFSLKLDTSWLDPAVRVINVEDHMTSNIWDWLGVLDCAEAAICVDSAMSNLIDSWGFDHMDLYWVRRSAWDLSPVLGSAWTIIETNRPLVKDLRVDPAELAQIKFRETSGLTTLSPFAAGGTIPTSFMYALDKNSRKSV